jgi:hypothetical protein
MKVAEGGGDYDKRCILTSNILCHIISYHIISFYKPIYIREPVRERDPDTDSEGGEREIGGRYSIIGRISA